jgi:cytochrome P450
MALPKHTYSTPQRLKVGDQSVFVPANALTSPSLLAVHTHPKYWTDPLAWKPTRWIIRSSGGDNDGPEELVTPSQNTYFPWSDDPQNCPGVKFSQVEFVAVLALLMYKHSLVVVKKARESEDAAKKRVMRVVNGCDMQILLRMQDAERVRLRCVLRL